MGNQYFTSGPKTVDRFYTCSECEARVRPKGLTAADEPGTRGYGSGTLCLCATCYKEFLRHHPERGASLRARAAVVERRPVMRAVLSSDERAVALHAASRVDDRGQLLQVLEILGMVDYA